MRRELLRAALRARLFEVIQAHSSDHVPLTAIQLGVATNKSADWVKAILAVMVSEGQISKVIVRAKGQQKGYCLPSHPMVERPTLKPIDVQKITSEAMRNRSPIERAWG